MRFLAILLTLALAVPVFAQEVECVSVPVDIGADGEVTVTFTPAVTADSVELYLHGLLELTLDAGPYDARIPVEISIDGLTRPQSAFLCVIAIVDDVPEDPVCCSVIVEADTSAAETIEDDYSLDPMEPPYFGFFFFDEDIVVGDVQVDVDVSLFDLSQLDVSVTSHEGTTVVLYGGQADGVALDVTFWELGGFSADLDCGCPRFPFGPGRMADLSGEALIDTGLGIGSWLVRIDGGSSTGLVDSVTIRIYEDIPAFPMTDVVCQQGEDPATSLTTWTTPVAYDSFEVIVDGGDIITIEGPFEAGEEAEFTTDPVALPATVVTCIRGVRGNAHGLFLCCFSELIVEPVTDLSCTSRGGSTAELSWVLGREYDEIEVHVDGELEATIDGVATEWSLEGPHDAGDILDVEVIGVLSGVGRSAATECRAMILEARDVEACAEVTEIPDGITVTVTQTLDDELAIEDLEMVLDLSTIFVTSWNIVLESARETSVTLHDVLVGNDGEFFLVYSDDGDENAAPYDCGCRLNPTGPGAMADFGQEQLQGEWSLTLLSVLAGGTVNAWCLRVDGCEITEPMDFECALIAGAASMTWVNTQDYDDIEVLQNGAVIATVDGEVELHVTADLPVGRYRFQLRAIDGGCAVTSRECSVLVGILDVCEIDVVVDAAEFEYAIDVGVDAEIAHTEVEFRYLNTILPELLSLESPTGTVVQLHDDPALAGGIDLVYGDAGVDNESPWVCDGCTMKPSGPGTLADFEGESTLGEWLLIVDTILPGGTIGNLCMMFETVEGGDGLGENPFLRGDVDNDGEVSCLLDAVALLNWNYLEGPTPDCMDAADLDDDGRVSGVVDALACLAWEFLSGEAPPDPGPTDCGLDGTIDGLSCEEATCD